MKLFKKTTSGFLIFVLIFSCCGISALGSGTNQLSLSSEKMLVGETGSLTINLSTDEPMYAVEAFVKYDNSILKFVANDFSHESDGVIHIVQAQNGTSSKSFVLNFTAISSGISTINVEDVIYCPFDTEEGNAGEISLPSASCSVNVSYILGDTNCDGAFNVKDLVYFKKQIANMITDIANADMDGNGLIEISDLVIMSQKLLEG